MADGKKSYSPDPKVKARGPKKTARTVDKKASKRAVLKQRACVICGEPATNAHHVLGRGAPNFGDDVPENLVALCGSGTEGCHGRITVNNITARRELGEHLVLSRPDTVAYVHMKLGPGPGSDWLARRLYIL